MRAGRARPERRGLTSVAVLVCLLIITMISGALAEDRRRPSRPGAQSRSASSRPSGWPSRASIARSPGWPRSRITRARRGN